ncbi:MAG: DNA-binding protein [Gemmatimonadota bacterium]
MEHTFLLRYRLPEDMATEEVVERLGAAGCDDALVGTGVPGRMALDFSREAESAGAALLSAMRDIREALPEARLVEAEPDLVGLTEAAWRVGVSRQNLHKMMKRHPGTFPSPVHAGSMAIWHLSDLLGWLKVHQGYELPAGLEELADAAKQVNLVCRAAALEPGISDEVRRLIA